VQGIPAWLFLDPEGEEALDASILDAVRLRVRIPLSKVIFQDRGGNDRDAILPR
jgi:hypothetical protein